METLGTADNAHRQAALGEGGEAGPVGRDRNRIGVGGPVERVESPGSGRTAVRVGTGRLLRKEAAQLVLGKARIAHSHPFQGRIETLRGAGMAAPLGVEIAKGEEKATESPGRVLEGQWGRAQPLDQGEALEGLGPCRRVERGCRAAHGVADQVNPLAFRCESREKRVEIPNVVGEMVVAARRHPRGLPVTSPVEGHDAEALPRQDLGHGPKAPGEIEEAVAEDQRGLAGRRGVVPDEDVVVDAVGDHAPLVDGDLVHTPRLPSRSVMKRAGSRAAASSPASRPRSRSPRMRAVTGARRIPFR